MRTRLEIIRLADMAAEIRREWGIYPPSACQILFEREAIPESEWEELRSLICKELGHRGGSRPKKSRQKTKKYSAKKIRLILAEAKWQIILEGAYDHEKFLIGSHPDP